MIIKTELYNLIFDKNISFKYKETNITNLLLKNYIKIKDSSKHVSYFDDIFETISISNGAIEVILKIKVNDGFNYVCEKIFKHGRKYNEHFLYDKNLEFKSYLKVIPSKYKNKEDNKKRPIKIEIKNNKYLYGFYKNSYHDVIYVDSDILKDLGVNTKNKFDISLNDKQLLMLNMFSI